MKGISLAIETIIVVILAVTVLTVMLFFFRSQTSPAQETLELINRQTSGCSGYIFYDYRCNNNIDTELRADLLESGILEKIAKSCAGLYIKEGSYPRCAGKATVSPANSDDLQCIQQCCRTFCQTGPI
ncbi:hypothetical protein ACFLQN_03535 [Candidatus Aenigmatarchaeota archaeon]